MKIQDGVVNSEIMRDAASSVSSFDTATAVSWMREREDTLGVFVQREAHRAIAVLKNQQGAILSPASESTVERSIVVTAIAAVTAVMSGHYLLWRDLMRGTVLSEIDPLLSIRRRIDTSSASRPARSSSLPEDGAQIDATVFRFVRCLPASDAADSGSPLVALTAASADGSLRHYALLRHDAETLFRELTDSLARLGSPAARAVWSLICSKDQKFDGLPNASSESPRNPKGPAKGEDEADGESGVRKSRPRK